MAMYRVAMILANDPTHPEENFTHTTRFAGCVDEQDARRKAREIYGKRVVTIKSVTKTED